MLHLDADGVMDSFKTMHIYDAGYQESSPHGVDLEDFLLDTRLAVDEVAAMHSSITEITTGNKILQ
jgi:hypothetical protein